MSTLVKVERRIEPDPFVDTSYLEQAEFADRLAKFHAGDFGYVGVRAVAEVKLDAGILVTIESPGLWSIEDDSGEDYFNEVYGEELATLREMLSELGVKDLTLAS